MDALTELRSAHEAAVTGAARVSLVEGVAEETDREALRSPTAQHSPTSPT